LTKNVTSTRGTKKKKGKKKKKREYNLEAQGAGLSHCLHTSFHLSLSHNNLEEYLPCRGEEGGERREKKKKEKRKKGMTQRQGGGGGRQGLRHFVTPHHPPGLWPGETDWRGKCRGEGGGEEKRKIKKRKKTLVVQ